MGIVAPLAGIALVHNAVPLAVLHVFPEIVVMVAVETVKFVL
jgi:hypothetical protein